MNQTQSTSESQKEEQKLIDEAKYLLQPYSFPMSMFWGIDFETYSKKYKECAQLLRNKDQYFKAGFYLEDVFDTFLKHQMYDKLLNLITEITNDYIQSQCISSLNRWVKKVYFNLENYECFEEIFIMAMNQVDLYLEDSKFKETVYLINAWGQLDLPKIKMYILAEKLAYISLIHGDNEYFKNKTMTGETLFVNVMKKLCLYYSELKNTDHKVHNYNFELVIYYTLTNANNKYHDEIVKHKLDLSSKQIIFVFELQRIIKYGCNKFSLKTLFNTYFSATSDIFKQIKDCLI